MPILCKLLLALILYAIFIHYAAKFCGFNNTPPRAMPTPLADRKN